MKNLLVLLVLAALVACKPAPLPPQEHAVPRAEPEAGVAPTAAAPSGDFGEEVLRLEPLARCEKRQRSVIHWRKSALAGGPIDIHIGEAKPQLFASVGAAGSKETGAWAKPGLVVTVRARDGRLLARQRFKGPGGCEAVRAADLPRP